MESVFRCFCLRLSFGFALIFFLVSVSFAAMPNPTDQFSFSYEPSILPVVDSDPALAKPIGLGPVARHGEVLELQFALDAQGPINVYVAVSALELDSELYMLTSANELKPISTVGLVPWKSRISGLINESVFGSVSMSILPLDTYTVFLAVSPSNTFEEYYLWDTKFTAGAKVVDSAGGQVGKPQSAMVSLPPDALSDPTAISVQTFNDPGTMPFPAFSLSDTTFGGGRFQPDGLSFNSPVTITLPLSKELPPGTEIPLYTYDELTQSWVRTENIASVNADGMSADAQVMHFTDFILMHRDMGSNDIFFGEFIDLFFDICNIIPISELYESYVRYFSSLYPIGAQKIYDFSFEFPPAGLRVL